MHMYGCGWRYRSREDDAEAQTQARGWLCSRAPGGEVHDPWGACEPAATLPGTQGHPGNGPRLSGSHESYGLADGFLTGGPCCWVSAVLPQRWGRGGPLGSGTS